MTAQARPSAMSARECEDVAGVRLPVQDEDVAVAGAEAEAEAEAVERAVDNDDDDAGTWLWASVRQASLSRWARQSAGRPRA